MKSSESATPLGWSIYAVGLALAAFAKAVEFDPDLRNRLQRP